MKKLLVFIFLFFSIHSDARQLVSDLNEVKDVDIQNLAKHWNNVNIEATDKFPASVYKFSKSKIFNQRSIAALFKSEYTEDIVLNEHIASDNVEVDAYKLAYALFTADPYIDNEDLGDIGKVLKPITDILSQKNNYLVYLVNTYGAFEGVHTSLAVASKETKEVLVLTAGYSE